MPYIPNTEQNENEMLRVLGVKSFDELLAEIPSQLRFKGKLDLPLPLSELEIMQLMRRLSGKNKNIHDYACFIGGGAYDHYIPAVVDHILSRSEFYTAYTPYQPEVSQGTLQAAFEYQSMICALTEMDVTNASMYDGGSALAEAVLLAHNHSKSGNQVLVSAGVNPHYLRIIQTYCRSQGIAIIEIPLNEQGITDLERLTSLLNPAACGVVVQHPNFFGNLEEVVEIEKLVHAHDTLFIVSYDPISLGILAPPGSYNTDIATGEGQVLGNSLSYGGPYLGLFSIKKELVRKMPGRLIGQTIDSKGRRGFVMTLQTREQHIRREKATSNICTNQALNALATTVYLSLLGKQGIQEVAEHCLQKSHHLARRISLLPNFKLVYSRPFFKEFVIAGPVAAKEIIRELKSENIFAGLDLGRFSASRKDQLLVAVTEKRSPEEIERYVQALKTKFV